MARRRRAEQSDASPPAAPDASVDAEVDEDDDEEDEDEDPIQVSLPSEPTYVVPRISATVRIGLKAYDFHAGIRISVPDEIVAHLRNTGVI